MTNAPQSSPALRRLPACAIALLAVLVGSSAAQDEATLASAAPFRVAVDGNVLADLRPGTRVRTGEVRGAWIRATLVGWIFAKSVAPTRRGGFDLGVTPDDGENLRETPNGRVLARLRSGMLLQRLETKDGWVRVRRTAWLPRKALGPEPIETAAVERRNAAAEDDAPEPIPAPKGVPPRQAPAQAPAQATAATPRATPPAGGAAAPSPSGSARGDGTLVEPAAATPLRTTPDGAEIGTLQPGATARVIARAGEWTRVQLEGWVRETDLKPAPGGALLGVSAAEIRANPDRYIGQVVEWRVQFISMQTADELRPELPAGRPFLLTRGPLPEPGFVYVILPPGQADRFQNLPALQELVLRVTVKAPRTRYLATPVVELASVVSGLPGQ